VDSEKLKHALPTVFGYLEKRRAAARNQLPKHLRPLQRRPILFQIALNAAIGFALCWLMWNRDEFMTEAAPAVGLVISLIFLVYTLITAMQYRSRYAKTPHDRLARINVWVMAVAALLWPASVAFFLP
jgi:hypothetical protein